MSSMGKAMMGTGEAEGEGRAAKATDLALNNPLIDDYSLRGAKGLLINITGGEDLTLFEVDEITNKIRAEVDPEAEIINGSIIEPTLEGKIRVSIVATALDGQQPESKSVINMVHRIQNRNPGYSDLSNLGSAQSFNFSNSMSNVVTDGANALKLENEIMTEVAPETSSTEQIKDINAEYNEQVLSNQENENEINIEDNTKFCD